MVKDKDKDRIRIEAEVRLNNILRIQSIPQRKHTTSPLQRLAY
jgi:hypothetical protein